jgi:hypothetical protein
MTLYKHSDTPAETVVYNSLEEAREDSEFESTNKALYADYMAAQLTSFRYAKEIDTFIKMSEVLPILHDDIVRDAMLKSMVHVLNEIGGYALQMFNIDDGIVMNSSAILEEKVLIPTAKFRDALKSLNGLYGIKTGGLEKLIIISDRLADDLTRKITENGGGNFFPTDRDKVH